MTSGFTWMQGWNLFLFLLMFLICVDWSVRRLKEDFWFIINPILFAVHGVIYYTIFLLDYGLGIIEMSINHQDWSAILRLHGTVAMLALVIIVISKRLINGKIHT